MRPLLRRIGLVQQRLVEVDVLLVLVIPVILGVDRVRQELADVHQRIDQALAVEVHRHVERIVAQRVEERAGRQHLLRGRARRSCSTRRSPRWRCTCTADRHCGSAARTSGPRRRPPSAGASPRRATSRCRASSRRASAAPPWSRPAASRGTRCRRRCAHWRSSTAPRAPCHWSIARISARRTRTSSNGFFLWFGVIMFTQFQSPVCTVILSPSSFTS